MAKPDSQWYRLDNAGILYSALQREEYSAIYRFSALMTEPVRPAALQNAIDRVLPRFPSFAVRIRRGRGPDLFPDAAGGVSAADRHKRSGRKRRAGPGGTAPEG